MQHTIEDAILSSEAITAYLDNADRRIVSGFRFALQTLNIPLPPAAQPKASGPKLGAIMRAYDSDNPAQAAIRREATAKNRRHRRAKELAEIADRNRTRRA